MSTPTCPALGLGPRASAYPILLGAEGRRGDPQEGAGQGAH